MSTSTDMKTWTAPQPSFAADRLDDELITAAGKHGQTPWSEIYGMPAIRYGDQYLGTPWVFDITYSPNRDTNDEVLDTNGNTLPGYAATNVTPITTDAKAPGAPVTWGANSTLPAGPIRLRFIQTGGDLYAYTVN